MSEKIINELRNKLAIQERVIEHLLIRSELSLYLLSAMLPTNSSLSADAVKLAIEQFKCDSPSVSPDVLEMEKRKAIKMISGI